MTVRNNSRGIALVIVLWVSALLAVIAGGFVSATSGESRIARNLVENAKSEALADAGINLAILKLLEPAGETAWRHDGTVQDVTVAGGQVAIMIEDEGGKVDLNHAPDEILRGVFASAGIGSDELDAIVDAVIDWRDTDNLRRLNGAEDSDYRAADRAYGAKDRPFEVLDELLHVLGMTPEIYAKAQPALTVYSGQAGIDFNTAPRQALLALPGVGVDDVETFLAARAVDDTTAITLFESIGDIRRFRGTANRSLFTIRALARTASGASFVREAVVQLRKGTRNPFEIRVWRRGAKASFDVTSPAGSAEAVQS